MIRVRDTGIGIPPDMLPRVFELFAQVGPLARPLAGRARHRPHARAQPGRACTAAAWSATSDGAGKGSEFIVRLPRASTANAGRVGAGGGGAPQRRRLPRPGRRRQRRCRRSAGRLLKLDGHDVRGRARRAGGARVARDFKPRHRAARHRPAGHEWLRSRARAAREPTTRDACSSRSAAMARRKISAVAGSGLRPPPGQAG